MNRRDADIIVVGAGPGGSIAAAVAAQAGARVLLVDKAEFPRDKICGDLVSPEAQEMLRRTGCDGLLHSPHGWTIDTALSVNSRGEAHLRRAEAGESVDGLPRVVMSRMVLDNLVRMHALESGAAFERMCVIAPLFDGARVVGVRGKSFGCAVERYGKVVIAADGAVSAIARKLLPRSRNPAHQGLAIRAYLPTKGDGERTLETYRLEWLMPGYGWYFPAGPRLANVGVGVRRDSHIRRGRTPLPELLHRFLQTPAISERAAGPPVEAGIWPIPSCSDHESSRVFDGALLVGDAGRFANALTGEGISQAMQTGAFAARAALEALGKGDVSLGGLRVYDELWRDELSDKMRWSKRIANLQAGMVLAGMRSDPVGS